MRYARDTNPGGKPPPIGERVRALIAAALFVGSLIVGASTGNDTLRAVCAVLCVIGLTWAMYYPAKSMDDARARGEDDYQDKF